MFICVRQAISKILAVTTATATMLARAFRFIYMYNNINDILVNKAAKCECLLLYVYGLLAIGRRSIDIGMWRMQQSISLT